MMLETLANSIRSIIYTLSGQLFYAACSIILCHIALQVIKKMICKYHWNMKERSFKKWICIFYNLEIYSLYLSIYWRTNEMHYFSFNVAMFIKEYIWRIFNNIGVVWIIYNLSLEGLIKHECYLISGFVYPIVAKYECTIFITSI